MDGARIPPNSSLIAPCRSTSMSSMLSAPAAIPATRQPTFRCAFTPHGPPVLRCSLTRSDSPAFSARAITGTRPARDTRFGSSNDACVFGRSCNNRTCEVSSPARRRKLQQLPSSQLRGHLSRRRARMHTYLPGGSRLSLWGRRRIGRRQGPNWWPWPGAPGPNADVRPGAPADLETQTAAAALPLPAGAQPPMWASPAAFSLGPEPIRSPP